jgi:hypothetical protein
MNYKNNARGRFEHLLGVISSKRFLDKQGLGKEVPFFICDYSLCRSPTTTNLVR